jgi:hypothetical protein
MTNIRNEVRAATGRKLQVSGLGRHGHHLWIISRRGSQKVEDRLPDLTAPIGVGHEIHPRGSMLKHTALKNFSLRLFTTGDPFPVGTAREKRLHAIRRAPIEVVFWVFPIPKFRRDRNDALALIIRQCHEDVDRAHSRVLSPSRGEYAAKDCPGEEYRLPAVDQVPFPSRTSRSNSTAYSAPSGVSSCLK